MRMCRKGNLMHCCWECKSIGTLWKTVWRFIKKLGIELPCTHMVFHFGYSFEWHGNTNWEIYMHPCVHCSIVYNSQDTEATKHLSMDEQGKLCCVWDAYNGVLLSHEDEILPFTTPWMDLGGVRGSEISQSEKDKYHVLSLMWNLRKQTSTVK